MGKIGDKVSGLCHKQKSRKSTTQTLKVGHMTCVADFHDMCPLSRTLSQSRHSGIWA